MPTAGSLPRSRYCAAPALAAGGPPALPGCLRARPLPGSGCSHLRNVESASVFCSAGKLAYSGANVSASFFAPSAFACVSAAYCFMSSSADAVLFSIRSRYRRAIVAPFSRIVSANVFHCGSCSGVIFNWLCRYLMRSSTRASWRAAAAGAEAAAAGADALVCACASVAASVSAAATVSEICFMGAPV
ncbi:hypothetical protein BTH_I2304 [Burkholderia thailandensis E264]|uniref:Uncharacterized protein n=1 Tax=Burkholderia thailandensis (strain ATCC 700388 / DSM 13276 / CCUG 48851 / CIP 106301 / E264) TaxID=271848 RepID=Q2SW74_BURTA|nr:hypothetical protein BTH_I2304 [Burkholderia thailandensis E264]